MALKLSLLTVAICAGVLFPIYASAESTSVSEEADFVLFPGGGSQLDPAAQEQLNALAELLNIPQLQDLCIRLVGHSDSNGSTSLNLTISKSRAESAATHLAARLKRPDRITGISGVGSAEPRINYSTSAREQRRVAVQVKECILTE
jgi:outer membrane protein OmpA-like peptidoglycan-associated protein